MAKRTASAKKQARAGARRAVRNRAVRSEVKTLIAKARRALSTAGGAGAASADGDRREATVEALRALDRAAAKRILHPNNAARRKSRLARRLARVSAGATASGAPSGAASETPGGGRGPAAARRQR